MQKYSKHIARALRQLLHEAYERELVRELRKLEESFAEWRAETISSGELSDRVHQYDTGPSGELFKQYNGGSLDMTVAYAIVVGVLKREEVPEEVLDALRSPLGFYQDLQERNELKLPGEW